MTLAVSNYIQLMFLQLDGSTCATNCAIDSPPSIVPRTAKQNRRVLELAISQLAFFAVYFRPLAFGLPPVSSSSFLDLLRSPCHSFCGSMHMLQPFSSCNPCLQNRGQPLKWNRWKLSKQSITMA